MLGNAEERWYGEKSRVLCNWRPGWESRMKSNDWHGRFWATQVDRRTLNPTTVRTRNFNTSDSWEEDVRLLWTSELAVPHLDNRTRRNEIILLWKRDNTSLCTTVATLHQIWILKIRVFAPTVRTLQLLENCPSSTGSSFHPIYHCNIVPFCLGAHRIEVIDLIHVLHIPVQRSTCRKDFAGVQIIGVRFHGDCAFLNNCPFKDT